MLHALIITVAFLSGFVGSHAAAQEVIGAVSRIQGDARATRDGATRTLSLHALVVSNETVSTGEAARLEITFTDKTRLTLGARAELTLNRYVFNRAVGRRTINFGVVGAFRFFSGRVLKLASSDINVTTPVATIGIRGTEFWAGPIDDQALGVLLIDGVVNVSNAGGRQILSRPGQGTNIARLGAGPGPVTFWPRDKVARAIAAVTFQ
jgi:hypothetical protein